jgi:hypothetical protein
MSEGNSVLNLSHETTFPDLNKNESKDANFARKTLTIGVLKYKNFREMQKLKEDDQMHYAIKTLTGLSDRDVGELYSDDAAELTGMVYNFMKKYVELGRKIRNDSQL